MTVVQAIVPWVVVILIIALVFMVVLRKPVNAQLEQTNSNFFNDVDHDAQNSHPSEQVDPWVLQRALMMASDQESPTLPAVTRTTLLYFALILEEVSELAVPLHDVLALNSEATNVHRMIANSIASIRQDAHETSLCLRELLKDMPDISIRPTRDQAREILDGTTDITVVNCGFSIAAGMLGDIAYARTVTSNLSKANPKTGKIDKTPDGKWIKGVDYKPPFLDDLIG